MYTVLWPALWLSLGSIREESVAAFLTPPTSRRRIVSRCTSYASGGHKKDCRSDGLTKLIVKEPSVVGATIGVEESSTIIPSTTDVLSSEELLGLAVLLTVPVVWGSYVPVVKMLYQIDPPIPGMVFSTAYFAVASMSSFGLLAILPSQQHAIDGLVDEADAGSDDETQSLAPILAGGELGFYLFLGNSLQVL